MVTTEQRRSLTRLVDVFIPAHTHYSWRVVQPGLRLGSANISNSALGLDSLISDHPAWRLPYQDENLIPGSESIVGAGSILPSQPLPPAVSVHLGFTRIGSNPKK
jgi:hypothetical protein